MKKIQIIGATLLILLSACQPAVTQIPQVAESGGDTPQLMITESAVPLQVDDATPIVDPTIINDVLYATSLQEGVDDQLLDIYPPSGTDYGR